MSERPSQRARINRENFQRSRTHELVVDTTDGLSCFRCPLPRADWLHGARQVRLVVDEYGGPDGSTVCRYIDEPLLAERPS